MENFTDLEKQVFNAIVENNYDDYSSTVEDLSGITGLDMNTIKGVCGSLVKKGKLTNDHEVRGGKMYNEFFIADPNWSGGYGCDYFEWGEYSDKFLIK